jgi:hypothetical protein
MDGMTNPLLSWRGGQREVIRHETTTREETLSPEAINAIRVLADECGRIAARTLDHEARLATIERTIIDIATRLKQQRVA